VGYTEEQYGTGRLPAGIEATVVVMRLGSTGEDVPVVLVDERLDEAAARRAGASALTAWRDTHRGRAAT
jgi:RNase H-fold protein (predicted Holliday junction resolvase)